jgi:hypothetical protein
MRNSLFGLPRPILYEQSLLCQGKLWACSWFGFSHVSPSLDFPYTVHASFPERLSNQCQCLCLTFSEIYTKCDAVMWTGDFRGTYYHHLQVRKSPKQETSVQQVARPLLIFNYEDGVHTFPRNFGICELHGATSQKMANSYFCMLWIINDIPKKISGCMQYIPVLVTLMGDVYICNKQASVPVRYAEIRRSVWKIMYILHCSTSFHFSSYRHSYVSKCLIKTGWTIRCLQRDLEWVRKSQSIIPLVRQMLRMYELQRWWD